MLVNDFITVLVMTITTTIQILRDMASKTVPKNPRPKTVVPAEKKLRLEEWMLLRGITPADLAAEWGPQKPAFHDGRTTSAGRIKHSWPRWRTIFEVPAGGLYQSPADASDRSLLAGLDAEQRETVMKFIAFTRGQK